MEKTKVCELCGKSTQLIRAMVEGTELEVCRPCGSFGKMLVPGRSHSIPVKKPIPAPELEEPTEKIVPNFAELVQKARERLGLKQEDLAKAINEKESILHKIETSTFVPPPGLARKLEKALNIVLIVPAKEEAVAQEQRRDGQVTIGDMIKRK